MFVISIIIHVPQKNKKGQETPALIFYNICHCPPYSRLKSRACGGYIIKENIGSFSGDIHAISGIVYMAPKVLSAGIAKGEVDKVFVVMPLPFPPTAYQLGAIEGDALRHYGFRLAGASEGETSWDIAKKMFQEKRD